ncbi:plasmid mobilization protein [Pontibacter liquoris]|uniref:plasmid mobilization protein n=1 Tax=Pontibacter liquoris TaxID=2905677 RepID=UPI001FA6B825|nr:plasmid mobilization relaxosome protein MobC [Pontibacter liquoris]
MMSDLKDNRTKWLHVRLTPAEYALLHRRCSQTTCRKLSDYARRRLLGKPVTAYYRNQSLDNFMGEMVRLRQALNSLGGNFNQAVKKLHTLERIPEFRVWLGTWELERDRLLGQVEEIKNKINTVADQWLQ